LLEPLKIIRSLTSYYLPAAAARVITEFSAAISARMAQTKKKMGFPDY